MDPLYTNSNQSNYIPSLNVGNLSANSLNVATIASNAILLEPNTTLIATGNLAPRVYNFPDALQNCNVLLQSITSSLTANSTRPAPQVGIQPYEIRGISSSATGDSGFLMLSAGGNNVILERTYIQISGFSNVSEMNQNVVIGNGNNQILKASGTPLVETVSLQPFSNNTYNLGSGARSWNTLYARDMRITEIFFASDSLNPLTQYQQGRNSSLSLTGPCNIGANIIWTIIGGIVTVTIQGSTNTSTTMNPLGGLMPSDIQPAHNITSLNQPIFIPTTVYNGGSLSRGTIYIYSADDSTYPGQMRIFVDDGAFFQGSGLCGFPTITFTYLLFR